MGSGLLYVGLYLPGKQGPGAEIGRGDFPVIILSGVYIMRSMVDPTSTGNTYHLRAASSRRRVGRGWRRCYPASARRGADSPARHATTLYPHPENLIEHLICPLYGLLLQEFNCYLFPRVSVPCYFVGVYLRGFWSV